MEKFEELTETFVNWNRKAFLEGFKEELNKTEQQELISNLSELVSKETESQIKDYLLLQL